MINVFIWNEGRHEKEYEEVAKLYPKGIHGAIAEFLKSDDLCIKTGTLDDENNGLSDEVLNETDVLIWWGHQYHDDVPDELVEKIYDRVLRGMGLIALHSSHYSKIFKKLMGTSCTLLYRDDAKERLWCVNPGHPIAAGVPNQFVLDVEEMYGEFFDIPEPDELIFVGWFNGGEVFRSGCTFKRGYGNIFYFQPGHESNSAFYNENVQKIISNAVRWAAPDKIVDEIKCYEHAPLEKID